MGIVIVQVTLPNMAHEYTLMDLEHNAVLDVELVQVCNVQVHATLGLSMHVHRAMKLGQATTWRRKG